MAENGWPSGVCNTGKAVNLLLFVQDSFVLFQYFWFGVSIVVTLLQSDYSKKLVRELGPFYPTQKTEKL